MNYRIRASEVSDSEVLADVHARAWRETYARLIPAPILAKMGSVEYRLAIRRGMHSRTTPDWAHLLVETDQGKIVGFGDCGPAQEVKEFAPSEIYTLYILQVAQGHGMGKKLIYSLLRHLSSRGFQKAALSVLAHNEAALQFYCRVGGREVNRSEMDVGGLLMPSAIYLWDDLKKLA